MRSSRPNRATRLRGWLFSAGLLGACALVACSGSDSGTAPEPPPEPAPGEVGTVGPAGGQLQTPDGSVSLVFPSGAVSGDVTITVQAVDTPVEGPNLVTESVYQFGPSGTQFSQPVDLSLRFDPNTLPGNREAAAATISKLIDGSWQQIEGDFEVSSTGVVTGQISSFSQAGVSVDPCWPSRVEAGYVSSDASWAPTDCVYTDSEGGETYEDLYEVTLSEPSAIDLVATAGSGVPIIAGWTSDVEGPGTGTVLMYDRAGDGVSYRTLLAAGTYRIWVGRDGGASQGSYDFSLSSASPENVAGCGGVGVVPPFTSAQSIDRTTDCEVTIQYAPLPDVIGKTTYEEYFVFKGFAGTTYSVTASKTGGDAAFAPWPTLFLGGGNVIQSNEGSADPSAATKTLDFTPTRTGYFTLGVSSVFGDNYSITEGSYDLTIAISGG